MGALSATLIGTILALAACAPSVDGPADHQRAIDRGDETRLAQQLAELPGATSANVTLRRPAADPLSLDKPTAPTGAALIVVETEADRARVVETSRVLMRAAAPEIAEPNIVVEIGRPPPKLASVGPFTVEAASRTPLRVALSIAFVVIIVLAGLLAYTRIKKR